MYAKNHSLCLHLISSTAPGETPHLGEARRGAAEDVGRCHVRRTTKGGRDDVRDGNSTDVGGGLVRISFFFFRMLDLDL